MWIQGCQMLYLFSYQKCDFGMFWKALGCKFSVYIIAIWYFWYRKYTKMAIKIPKDHDIYVCLPKYTKIGIFSMKMGCS
jgi:hypothetical protein